jgi:hypothetical protein
MCNVCHSYGKYIGCKEWRITRIKKTEQVSRINISDSSYYSNSIFLTRNPKTLSNTISHANAQEN